MDRRRICFGDFENRWRKLWGEPGGAVGRGQWTGGGPVRKRAAMRWLAALIVLGASACAQRQAGVVDCTNFVVSPSDFGITFAGRAGTVTQQEHTFICRGLMVGRAQLTFARMAQQQSTNPAVMRYAEQAIGEQEEMNRRLARIAVQQDGIIPPRGLDAPHLAMRDQLAQLSGYAFDRAYLENEVREGRAAIANFKQEMEAGAEPVLNKFAANALPLVARRVQLAQSMIGQ
jgi:putative membrane protein